MIYNWNIIGHDGTLELLEKDLSSDNLAHAYLFSGPSQLGKFTIARQMASILQCENNFCRNCKVCLQIRKDSHADTIVAKNDQGSVKVEFIRDLIDRVNLTTQSRHTMVLIEEIERMTPAAANAFLKTLEEPPKNVIFILTTENIKQILPTIVSRVRVINFAICSDELLKEHLISRFPDIQAQTINQASLLALGKPGKAIGFLEDREGLSYYQSLYDEVCTLLETDGVHHKFKYVDRLLEEDYMASDFLDILEHVLRSRMLKQSLEPTKGRDDYISLIENTQSARSNLGRNINARLLLENLLLAI